jgi:hypothetical protein
MPKDFIPKSDAGKLSWSQNIEDKLATHATELGLSAADVTEQKALFAAIRKAVNDKAAAQANAKKVNTESDLLVAENIKLLRQKIQGWKKQPTYTEGIGADLQIIGTDSGFDPKTFKTTLTSTVYPGRVEIGFVKSETEGVNVYTRLKGQPNWTKLSFDAHPPYVDNRPLAVAHTPEHREYMAIGVIDDAEIGQSSDIIEVVYGG